MARALMRFNKPTAAFWVQDYHFLTLGAEMRELGVRNPLGFFLHTPWPARRVIAGVPHHRELVEAMLAYDLIGFQTEDDCENFTTYLRAEIGLDVDDSIVTSRFGTSRLAVFPIGIDVDGFAAQAQRAASHPDVSRLRKSLHGERLAIGVDRVDYSKGLVNRISAFDRLFEIQPSLKRSVSLLQIATPSRGGIEAYSNLQDELSKQVTDVNGRHGEVDWTPIRYLNKGFSQTVLAGFYRAAQVGVVTPLHDGMNLVAKEYVAAQNPIDPGVLVLSKFAGAANELDTALLVNPHDIDGMAPDHCHCIVDAGDGTADAVGGDDDQTTRRHHPSLVLRLYRCAGKRAYGDRAEHIAVSRASVAGSRGDPIGDGRMRDSSRFQPRPMVN